MTNKKIYRSNSDKMLAGVCGGLAEYFEADATALRLLWALIVVFTGFFPGAIVYVIAAVIMPSKQGKSVVDSVSEDIKL